MRYFPKITHKNIKDIKINEIIVYKEGDFYHIGRKISQGDIKPMNNVLYETLNQAKKY